MDKNKFCDSGLVNFTDFTVTNDPIISKTWDFKDGNMSIQNDPNNYYKSPGTYLPVLKVSTQNNCVENYTDTVRIYQTPHPVFTPSPPFCVGAPIQFQGGLVTPEINAVKWFWNFGNGQTSSQQNHTVTYTSAGPYTVHLLTSVSFGCSDSTKTDININALPVIQGPPEVTTPVGLPVTLPITYSSGIANYSWTPANNLSCTDCPDPVANPIFTTLYKVTVTDKNNCVSSAAITVKTVCNGKNYFIPNTFSPNGDGVNDVFYPRGNNVNNIQSMRIFNRWGQLVFERRSFPPNTPGNGWNGTFNGKPAPVDAYVYIIEVICENAQIVALKGDVTLVR
jgi:gliding motility-associated-like protein